MDGEKLIARVLIFALGGVFIGVLISGAAEVKDRWLQPMLFLDARCFFQPSWDVP